MAAGLLLRRAAGMKNRRAFVRCETGQFQFLERGGRHGGNLRPMFDGCRRQLARLANFPIGGVMFELEREQFQVRANQTAHCELRIHRQETGAVEISPRRRAAKLESSGFMRCLFAGWFSATAEAHDNTNPVRLQARLPLPLLSATLLIRQ